MAALASRLTDNPDQPFTILTHELAWTVGVGSHLEPAGFRPASREAALEGLAAGQYVLVMPGGDLDAGKSFARRNEILFGGRTGFAQLAIDAHVDIIPFVVSGAGETLFVVSDGQRLARWLGLPARARMKTLPISISVPWGLSIGGTGMLFPYFPLPAKMRAAVLEPIHPTEDDDAATLAARVHEVMAAKLVELTAGRIPILGTRWNDLPGRNES